ncbi:MAG: MauE/DoxX family redox-associated membrane protein [Bryobacteraceae bacterium]
MTPLARIARTGLRLALGTAFLSAVASRLGLWGHYGSDWASFLKYAAQVNWYLPSALIPTIAIVSTALELTFGCLLVIGWRVHWVAFGSAALLLTFALAMASGDPKSPFDYSVFTAAFGALTLATTERR